MKDNLLSLLQREFSFLTERETLDCTAVQCPVNELQAFMKQVKSVWGFDMLVDLTAIDNHEESPRFTVIYHLFSTAGFSYLRVACDCLDDAEPEMPSVVAIWPAADWHEREAFDMFGICFKGHPNLKRILMWDAYPYFPLRKDFPLAGVEVDLPAADVAESTGESVMPAPMMGGPFHAGHGSVMSESEPRADDESWTEERPKPTGKCRKSKESDAVK